MARLARVEVVVESVCCESDEGFSPASETRATLVRRAVSSQAGARCSNKGFLPMSTADYLSVLDGSVSDSIGLLWAAHCGCRRRSNRSFFNRDVPARPFRPQTNLIFILPLAVPEYPFGLQPNFFVSREDSVRW
jgi:hypothetical protein